MSASGLVFASVKTSDRQFQPGTGFEVPTPQRQTFSVAATTGEKPCC